VRRAAARVFEVMDTPPPVRGPENPVVLGDGPHALRTRGLRYRYPGAAHWALDGIDLDLRPGRRVAVVGPSGAGKSTLAGVLLRFLPYERISDETGPGEVATTGKGGSVTLDGVELTELDGDDVRRAVGLVSQDAHVFDSTLEENLRLAQRGAAEGELEDVLAAARLLDWTRTLPLGLQTEIGERGARMSGGQRQRLAIARALLADFPVLILDEPGEHLDTQTADAIVADLLKVTEGRTTLLITHRLTGLEEVDEVLVLDRSRVLERGTHMTLLALGGRYAALWRREQE
jgi:ABC-type multidrug transport system fused ATPase/permease subunit